MGYCTRITRFYGVKNDVFSGSTYADNSTGLDQVNVTLGTVAQQRGLEGGEVTDKERDLEEMEAWLQDKVLH